LEVCTYLNYNQKLSRARKNGSNVFCRSNQRPIILQH
jgi:hypothetical protein